MAALPGPGVYWLHRGGSCATQGWGRRASAVTQAAIGAWLSLSTRGRCPGWARSSADCVPSVSTFSAEVMEHSISVTTPLSSHNSVTIPLSPLPPWTRHLNLSRAELETLIQRVHRNPVISVLRDQGETAGNTGEDGLNNVILVASGVCILLLLLIIIKCKKPEELKR